jgi:hypothetical protein
MFAHCYVARVVGGALIDDGPEGSGQVVPARRPSRHRAYPGSQPAGAGRLPGAVKTSIGPTGRRVLIRYSQVIPNHGIRREL